MNKTKILTKYFSIKQSKNLKKNEKKLMINHKDWKVLTKEEKKFIDKMNLNTSKIMKNVFYDWNNVEKKYFVSDIYYQTKILPKLNTINYDDFGRVFGISCFTDKNFEEKYAYLFKFPNCVFRCIDGQFYNEDFKYIESIDVEKLSIKYNNLVFKRTFGEGHGKNVYLVNKGEFKKNIKDFGNNYVVQETIKQHEFLSNFNSSSVNVIRITSLLWEGKVYILGGLLRVGAPGAFCDHQGNDCTGPRVIGLDENGNLLPYSIDPDKALVYDNIFGKKIEGEIPFYNEIKEKVCQQHLEFLHYKIIGWDITINNENEIICIEFNSNCPGIIQTQMACGPIFSKKLDNNKVLLDEILNSK